MLAALAAVGLAAGAATLLLWPSGRSPGAPGGAASFIPAAARKPLPALAGAAVDPASLRLDLRAVGRPQFIGVWASWCLPCKEEAPTLAALDRRYRGRVRFIGIDVEDSRSAARAFQRRYGIGYPSIFDEQANTARQLGFYGLPTAYLIDRQGRIAATLVGKQRPSVLRNMVRRLASLGV